MAKIKLDDVEYELNNLTETAQRIVSEAQKTDILIKEKANMLAVLTKAKRAYISDLKREMLSIKAGLDLLE